MPELMLKPKEESHLAVMLNAKRVHEIIRAIPNDELQLNRLENDRVEICSRKSGFKIDGIDAPELTQPHSASSSHRFRGSIGRLIETDGYRLALTVALLTFLLRFLYSALTLSGDALNYFFTFNGWGEIAGNIAAGKGMMHSAMLGYLILEEPRLTAARSPLPLIMNAALIRTFGHIATPIYVMQAVFEGATAAVIAVAGKSVARRYIYGLFGALLYMVFIPALHYSRTMGSEPLAAFLTSLLMINLILCLRYHNALYFLSLGMLLGALTLTRPTYVIYLAPCVFTFLIVKGKRGFWLACLILLSFTVTVLPWGLRNYGVLGSPIITSTLGGYNLYRHNEPLKRSTYLEEGQQRHEPAVTRITNLLSERGIAYEDLNEAQLDRLLKQEAIGIILANKARYLRLSMERVLWLFSSNGRTAYPQLLWAMIIILFVAAYGTYRYAIQYGLAEALLLASVVVLWVFAHSLIVAQLRYLIPVMPVICFLAAFGFVHCRRKKALYGARTSHKL